MGSKNKLLFGVGVNDANYSIRKGPRGNNIVCRFYVRWADMIKRCYSTKHQAKRPTYIGCTVCHEWLTFSKFKTWMEKQDWEGKELDKDILVKGNKVYSPETCAFISKDLNKFTSERCASRGNHPLGVWFHAQNKNYVAECRNPFTKKRGHIGCFDCPHEAHQAWRKRKHELACQLADLQSDQRVAKALRTRYL